MLARVVDLGGRPFVLDYGDARVIEDLVQRINRGFTVIRHNHLVHVHPEDPDLVEQLASFYIGEGALVFLEEPTWIGRTQPPSGPSPIVPMAADFSEDETTEMV
jgi:hypothetical protein